MCVQSKKYMFNVYAKYIILMCNLCTKYTIHMCNVYKVYNTHVLGVYRVYYKPVECLFILLYSIKISILKF